MANLKITTADMLAASDDAFNHRPIKPVVVYREGEPVWIPRDPAYVLINLGGFGETEFFLKDGSSFWASPVRGINWFDPTLDTSRFDARTKVAIERDEVRVYAPGARVELDRKALGQVLEFRLRPYPRDPLDKTARGSIEALAPLAKIVAGMSWPAGVSYNHTYSDVGAYLEKRLDTLRRSRDLAEQAKRSAVLKTSDQVGTRVL